MPVRAEQRYNGTVGSGATFIETQRGSLGFQIPLSCSDGETSFTIWLTPKNRDNARSAFEALGVSVDKLSDPGYTQHQIALDVEGREVSFGTKEEEYKGRTSIKVAWIAPKKDGLEKSPAARAADFFAGKSNDGNDKSGDSNSSAGGNGDQLEDDDIPF